MANNSVRQIGDKIARVSGLPKGLGERRFKMGEGGGGAFSLFRFSLPPIPQKHLILKIAQRFYDQGKCPLHRGWAGLCV